MRVRVRVRVGRAARTDTNGDLTVLTHLNSPHYSLRSDESDMWKKHPDVLKVCNGESGWAFGKDGDDGIFWMDFEDFVQVRYYLLL